MIAEKPGMWNNCLQNQGKTSYCTECCETRAKHLSLPTTEEYMWVGQCIYECEFLEAPNSFGCWPEVPYEFDYISELRAQADFLLLCLEASFHPGCTDKPTTMLGAIAEMFNYGAINFPQLSSPELSDAVTSVLVGTSGSDTIHEASQQPFDARHELVTGPSTGFHSDYANEDQIGQGYHFLAYFNTVAQGGTIVAVLGDIRHECTTGLGSVIDARLSTQAIRLGREIDKIPPRQLGTEIYVTLSSEFDDKLLWYYYTEICDLPGRGIEGHNPSTFWDGWGGRYIIWPMKFPRLSLP